jgi:hypothetical protein
MANKISIDYLQFEKVTGDENNDEFARSENRQKLREGVVGIECLYAGSMDECTLILQPTKDLLLSRLNPDETFGTVESYANGIHNVFVRVLDDGGNLLYIDGIFKVKE